MQRPTSRDVAAHARVSVATVSYVLSGRRDVRVGEETRRRVLAAADELAYAPNSSASSLRRRRTDRVCLVVGAVGVPANNRLASDLHEEADRAGYGVITIVVDSRSRAHRAIDLLHQRIADGAIISSAVLTHLGDEGLDRLARSGLPLVVLSNVVAPDGFDVVRTPEAQVCGEAFDHLVATGRRRIAFMAHHHDLVPNACSDRLAAYEAALARHGFDPSRRLVVPGADDRVAAYRAARSLLEFAEPPDAIFAASDRAAISTIWALRDAGRTVPDEVAVIGVGNLPEGEVTMPALSTVGPASQDYSELARLLFERVLADKPLPGREATLAWSFIRRGSA